MVEVLGAERGDGGGQDTEEYLSEHGCLWW